MISQHRQRLPALPVHQQMHIINHQHHRHRHRPERRPQPRHHRPRHRTPRRRQRRKHPPPHRLHPIQRPRHTPKQHPRIIIPLIHRHPPERPAPPPRPLRQHRRLPVPRRRHHRHNRTAVLTRQPIQQPRPANHPRPHRGRTQLRHTTTHTRPRPALSQDQPLIKVALGHAPNRVSRDGCAVPCSCVAFITSRKLQCKLLSRAEPRQPDKPSEEPGRADAVLRPLSP